MEERRMLEQLEEGRIKSKELNTTVWAMTKGDGNIVNVTCRGFKDSMKESGWWIVSIFEDGHRVEA